MKIHWTRKVAYTGVAYLVVCAITVYLGDFLFKAKLAFLPNIIVGLLTIIGGVLVAWWFFESNRFSRELERKKRVVSTLKILRNFLLPWIYHYAIALSGHSELQDDYVANRIANRIFKNDVNLLEYIFGIRVLNKDGNVIRGNYQDPEEKISKHPFVLQTIRGSLDYGLQNLEEIEKRIKEFPSFLEEIDTEIAKIIHLSNYMRERIIELQEWESNYGKEQDYEINFSMSNVAIRGNLKTVGRTALEIIIAIDTNFEKLEAEL